QTTDRGTAKPWNAFARSPWCRERESNSTQAWPGEAEKPWFEYENGAIACHARPVRARLKGYVKGYGFGAAPASRPGPDPGHRAVEQVSGQRHGSGAGPDGGELPQPAAGPRRVPLPLGRRPDPAGPRGRPDRQRLRGRCPGVTAEARPGGRRPLRAERPSAASRA